MVARLGMEHGREITKPLRAFRRCLLMMGGMMITAVLLTK